MIRTDCCIYSPPASCFCSCLRRPLAGPADKRLDMYWIDVEGGAATLLVTPAGETVLIDTGNPGRRDPDRIVKALTKSPGMKQIDHLIITHYHGDHFGGATDARPICCRSATSTTTASSRACPTIRARPIST